MYVKKSVLSAQRGRAAAHCTIVFNPVRPLSRWNVLSGTQALIDRTCYVVSRYFCIASKPALPVALPQLPQPCQCTPAVLLQLKHQGAGAEQLIAAAQQQQVSCGSHAPPSRWHLPAELMAWGTTPD